MASWAATYIPVKEPELDVRERRLGGTNRAVVLFMMGG